MSVADWPVQHKIQFSPILSLDFQDLKSLYTRMVANYCLYIFRLLGFSRCCHRPRRKLHPQQQ